MTRRPSTSGSPWQFLTCFEVASETPLLMEAEDAHWLDRATSEVLAFVTRRVESDAIVILAATRDGPSPNRR
jgi:hypothetical protein